MSVRPSSRQLGVLLVLGFASGLPATVLGDPLKLSLQAAGVEPATLVRLAAVVSLVMGLKVLWAPLVDGVTLPLGRRRGWMLLMQLGLLVAIAALGQIAAVGPLLWAAVVLIAVLSATQDVAVNAFTCEACDDRWRPLGAGLSVWGYRAAILVAGTGGLLVAQHWGWPLAFVALALAMVPCALASVLASEPPAPAPATWRDTIVAPLRALWLGHGPRLLLIAVFILLFRLPDQIGNSLAAPFLKSQGYDLAALALWRNGLGLAGTAVGVLAGGFMAVRLGHVPTLVVAGVLAALSNGAYLLMAAGYLPGIPGLATLTLVETACGGMAGAAFVAYLMSFCTAGLAGTQYALLTSIMALGGSLIAPFGRLPASSWGYEGFFLASVVAAVPGLMLVPWLTRRVTAETAGSDSAPGPAGRPDSRG